LVARAVARHARVPWVAELRDLWTENHNFRRIQPLRSLETRLERSVLSAADALVTVSEVWADRLRQQFGRPTFVVPNGFDSEDYPTGVTPSRGMFTLTYTGMLYDGKQNPAPLLDAIGRLAAAGRINPARFRARFVGQYLAPITLGAQARGISAFCEVEPPVPYREALARQCASTCLIFFDWADGQQKGWYSAKIYEYLGARRPILSVGPHDTVVAQLLQRTGAGSVAVSADELTRVLETWLDEWERSGEVAYTAAEAVRRFERRESARAMADVLDFATGHPHAALHATTA
jgi:hypothetical protein